MRAERGTRVHARVYRARFTHFEAIESDGEGERGQGKQGGCKRDEEPGDRRYQATAAVDIRIRHITATRSRSGIAIADRLAVAREQIPVPESVSLIDRSSPMILTSDRDERLFPISERRVFSDQRLFVRAFCDRAMTACVRAFVAIIARFLIGTDKRRTGTA